MRILFFFEQDNIKTNKQAGVTINGFLNKKISFVILMFWLFSNVSKVPNTMHKMNGKQDKFNLTFTLGQGRVS